MNLIEATKDMSILTNPTAEGVKKQLEEDYHVIVADKNNYGDNMLKYDFFIMDGVLYAAKMSDSTRDTITLTLESAALYTDEYFSGLWESYLSGKDVFIIDTVGHMHEAEIRSGAFDLKTIKKQLHDKEVFYFNDPYSPIEGMDVKETNIYVIENKEPQIIGLDALKGTIETVTGAKLIDEQGKADIIILILPNATKAPHKKFFEWLTDKTANIPVVAKTVKEASSLRVDNHDKVLLFWSSNAFMAGLFDPKSALFKSAVELSDIINGMQN